MQEAIRMSLQDHQSGSGEDSTLDRDYSPTPSAPPPPPLTTASTDSLVHDQTPVTSQPSYNPGHRTASDDNGGLEGRGDDRALLPLGEYREAPEDRTLRRRHVEDRSEGEQSDNNMRAARLKRFGKNKNN